MRALHSIPIATECILILACLSCRTQYVFGQNEEVPSYGVDVSFPMHAKRASTNYPWLPHNVNPQKISTPPEFEGVSVQPLGDRDTIHEKYMQGCRDYWEEEGPVCDEVEYDRIEMNINQPKSMVNYTETGYKKMRTPDHIFKMILDFWESNKENTTDEDWFPGNVYVNYWESPSIFVDVHDGSLKGGGRSLVDAIHNSTEGIIQEWTGQKLIPSSLYGIRVYQENAVLSPHVDRNPLINSGIINVAQDVDEPWPLEVIGHDGIARNVTMEPGDLVLYESHSVIHGRPFPLKGRYFANVFIHFEPHHSMKREGGSTLPPYVLEGSSTAIEHEMSQDVEADRNTVDNLQHAAHLAARAGDLDSFKELCQADEGVIHRKDGNGWQPIHEAARAGALGVLKYIIKVGGDVSHRANHGVGPTPLEIANGSLPLNDPSIRTLRRYTERETLTGAARRKKKQGWHPIHNAAKQGRLETLKNLVLNGFDINHPTDQGNGPTPLSLALNNLEIGHPVIDFLKSNGAVLSSEL